LIFFGQGQIPKPRTKVHSGLRSLEFLSLDANVIGAEFAISS